MPPNNDFENIIDAIRSLPFPVGKKLLVEILFGKVSKKVIERSLLTTEYFGCMSNYLPSEISNIIERMVFNGLLDVVAVENNTFARVVRLSSKGILMRSGEEKINSNNYDCAYSNIYELKADDVKQFQKYGSFLSNLNNHQKKAVTSTAQHILCIAGAGTGKTTVLVKRIESLVKLKNVPDSKILAITFTRKARNQMKDRLNEIIPHNSVKIETFNSLCEKVLKKNVKLIYDKEFRVLTFSDKLTLLANAIKSKNMSIEQALYMFYQKRIPQDNTHEQFLSMAHDIFDLIDYYTNNNLELSHMLSLSEKIKTSTKKQTIQFIYQLIKNISQQKQDLGLRDFSDQLAHTIKLFESHSESIPLFEHILVDEYQDVNDMQIKLLKLLNSPNIFAVGDPRQSIYGWRGSNVNHILNFSNKQKQTEIIPLNINYRSSQHIINLANKIIKPMKLPDLEADKSNITSEEIGKSIKIIKHNDLMTENIVISNSILQQKCSRNKIFVLARTNSRLDEFTQLLDSNNIKYIKRSFEERTEEVEAGEDEIVLSTVHAIKGLEADTVYILSANANHFPCMISETSICDALKTNRKYDEYDEELRLLYVAISRARKNLIISYTTKLTPFMPPTIVAELQNHNLNSFNNKHPKTNNQQLMTHNQQPMTNNQQPSLDQQQKIIKKLKSWRFLTAKRENKIAYQIIHNKTIEEIAKYLPRNIDELAIINGIGPDKIKNYGDAILSVLAKMK